MGSCGLDDAVIGDSMGLGLEVVLRFRGLAKMVLEVQSGLIDYPPYKRVVQVFQVGGSFRR